MPGSTPKYIGKNSLAWGAALASAAAAFTPPTDTTYLSNTIAGAGADNRVILGNWLTPTTNSTQANNATSYSGTANGSNTITGAAATGTHESTSGLISASGWATFGGAFKKSAGNATFACLYSGTDNTNFASFNLSTGALATNGGTAVGAIFDLGSGWYWCRVTFSVAKGANQTAKFNWGNTDANSQPLGSFTTTTGDILLAGPWACTA